MMAEEGIMGTIDVAADVAEASVVGLFKAVITGAIPILVFGAMVGISILVIQLPLRLFDGE